MRFSNTQTKSLRNSVFRQTVLHVVLFTIAYALFFLFFDEYLKPVISNALYYSILSGIDYFTYELLTSPYLLLAAAVYLAGVFLIVRSGLNRSFSFFDALFSSIENMTADSKEAISLPSELAETAEQLNDLKIASQRNERAAKAAEERKNELVVYLAHDIKTPLTSIIGYMTLLTESPDMAIEARAKYADIALDKAYRLEELIEEFFEITRYNLQTIPIERSRFDAVLFCQQVVDDLHPQAQARSLELKLESPEYLEVFADANRLSRVLDNIVKNAISYADEKSTIWLTLESQTLDDEAWLKILVTNKGREISPQHLERIFEKFYRGDDARSSNSGGAGLGLAIAHEISRAHGGDITAASENGITTFAIWIPQT